MPRKNKITIFKKLPLFLTSSPNKGGFIVVYFLKTIYQLIKSYGISYKNEQRAKKAVCI